MMDFDTASGPHGPPSSGRGWGQGWHATTILMVRKGGRTVIGGDGQVSIGQTIVKGNAKKVRRLGKGGEVIAGFAGATADAFTLFERLEAKLEQYPAQLTRVSAAVKAALRCGLPDPQQALPGRVGCAVAGQDAFQPRGQRQLGHLLGWLSLMTKMAVNKISHFACKARPAGVRGLDDVVATLKNDEICPLDSGRDFFAGMQGNNGVIFGMHNQRRHSKRG